MENITQSINSDWNQLSITAWSTRNHAHIFGTTKVGASILSENGNIFSGCNVEHKFRCHDIHAEVNAVSNMVAAGEYKIKAILIVAEREFFTPCGSCMDWIMQFADSDTLIGFQSRANFDIKVYTSQELMPYYPK